MCRENFMRNPSFSWEGVLPKLSVLPVVITSLK
jgi:hypothetical protein